MTSSKRIRKMVMMTMLLALGVILHFAEGMVELPSIPGVRLGFANVIGLITLYLYGPREMMEINLGRVVFGSLLSGRIFSTGFFLSLSGVIVCSLASVIAYRYTKLSTLGVSVLSSATHGVGQMIAVIFIYNTKAMIYYLPILTLTSIPTGLFTGYIAYLVTKHLKGGIHYGI